MPHAIAIPLAPYRHRWLVFAAMLAGEVMDVLDMGILHVAGPALEHELGATPAQLQWAVGGYALAMGACLIVGGRLGDVYGRRRMFLTALAGFALTSLLCALAPTMHLLIVARLLQGVAGALLLPQGFALLRAVFGPDELGKALAIFGPVMGLAAIAGPVVGGGIIAADYFGLGWRFALGVNTPVALAALLVAWRCVPRDPPQALAGEVDLSGAALIAISCGLLVAPLIQGQEAGWPLWAWASLGLAGAGFTSFVRQQRRRVHSGRVPLVEPGLFAKPAFSAGILGMGLFFSAFIGMQLVFTLFLQLGQGYGAGEAGLAALPLTGGCFIGSGLAGGFLLERIGARVLQLGAVLQIAAVAWLWRALDSTGFSLTALAPALVLLGVGGGMVIASLITIIISAVDEREAGSGSGLLAAVQAISSAAGIALLSGLFFGRLAAGDPAGGYRLALAAQALLLILFLLVSFALPVRSRATATA
ncbi:MFS transporter [Duganella sp. FT80W]|uniref:MFS transporter n=1 Tax=Duganella guangzhouensis TaxID=2666084 RepID=A0A6I2KX04_9BURK|nr:MFS transporter [Duganella guangzhouensis]MRW88509.1 MFS transporter [Duganella guangzhouensis]